MDNKIYFFLKLSFLNKEIYDIIITIYYTYNILLFKNIFKIYKRRSKNDKGIQKV